MRSIRSWLARHPRVPLLLLLSLLFATAAPAASGSAATCSGFSDLPETHPACPAVRKLVADGVINGYPDGSFRPGSPVTRAEFAKMAVLALGNQADPNGAPPFTDVAGHWAGLQGYLQAAVAMGAIDGFDDGTFRPDDLITRAQAVKIPTATLNLYPRGTPPYTDVSASDWFAGWVSVSHRAALIGPRAPFPLWTGSTLNGNSLATRAEAAMLLANLPLTPRQASQAISSRAAQAITALKDQDMAALAALVHPERGVRFSAYAYVDAGPSGDLTFPASWLNTALTNPTVYTWGAYDGSGDPIERTFRQYYDRFIYDQNFAAAPNVSFNTTGQRGNTINNLLEAYPGHAWVEYHFPGFDPQYAGMDWRSLRLVFEFANGQWYLVGMIHDEWTI